MVFPIPPPRIATMIRASQCCSFVVGVAACCAALAAVRPCRAEDWPQWRGPRHDGTSHEKNLPVSWSKSSGIVWQCPLPQWGDSTPAIWGDSIFLTSHVDNRELLLLKISKQEGRIEWVRPVGVGAIPDKATQPADGERRRQQWFHDSHNYASPSPVTDGELVVAHFGNGDLAAYDFDGKQLWHRNLQTDHGKYTIWWGHANSPVLFGDLVISVCMQDPGADLPGERAPSYVVAHDKRTGQERWKTMRMTAANSEPGDSYITPILWRNGDRQELVVLGGLMLDAYDPGSGKQLWWLPNLVGNRTITGPVAAHNMIFATQGMRQPVLAVRPGGDGQRPEGDIVWQSPKGTPDGVTPVVWGPWLFLVNNDGVIRCCDATTGKEQWKERLKGDFRASPLAAEGRVYFLNTAGTATVVAASPKFERLAENVLDDETLASPVASDGRIYIRGRKALYCLGK